MGNALSHAAIVLSGMVIVLLVIDRLNSGMVFIDNDYTKGILWALSIIAIGNSIRLIRRNGGKSA
ncbi:MAG: hypothetical protein GX558_08540 [Clostridiales bacterium]|nr:hypothetical protein [Clostridiales bacterium]